MIRRLIDWVAFAPKRLFLLDGLGALLTAFLLGIVLVQFEEQVGLPPGMISSLALVACAFAFYSLACYKLVKNWRPYLLVIAFANAVYSFFTLGMLVYYHQRVTTLGVTYFLLEFIVVSGVVAIEVAAIFRGFPQKNS
jgi:uncharacterized membrane protein